MTGARMALDVGIYVYLSFSLYVSSHFYSSLYVYLPCLGGSSILRLRAGADGGRRVDGARDDRPSGDGSAAVAATYDGEIEQIEGTINLRFIIHSSFTITGSFICSTI